MPPGEPIELELRRSAQKVDRFIYDLLEPVRPQVLKDAASHIIMAGGKRLRPHLVLKSCELLGGDADAAVPFAAALEILHNFTLVHDDIMDNDDVRRGVPTVHARWGTPIAITSGDLLFAKVYDAMTSSAASRALPCSCIKACIERVTQAAIALCEGQALDITFPSASGISEGDYIYMVGKKTAALFRACAEVGAIAGGGDMEEVDRLGGFAWNAGVAFQLVDDYLGVVSDEGTLGKPVGSDLREGKKTLIVIHALRHASPEDRGMIESVLGAEDASPENLEVTINILRRLGSLDYAVERARQYAGWAKALLETFPNSKTKRGLMELIEYFIERTH